MGRRDAVLGDLSALDFGQPLDGEFIELLCWSVDSLFSTDAKSKASRLKSKT